MSSLKARQKECAKSVILTPATLGLWKTETASENHPLKTKLLNRANDTEKSGVQVNNNYNTHEEERERPKSLFQDNIPEFKIWQQAELLTA
ncbi:hypothetical protein G9A89_005879 [Geosiphon pyriformis]|nr:hypothetical protein G9A89_005879 [Geosiphon pyriformis]